jgi:ribonuclease BN (tRNA processing enzyme)
VFDELMRPPFFPIEVSQLPGAVRFVGIEIDDFPVGRAKVRSRWIRHTSPTLGYRVELEGVSVAYVSDHGPGCSDDAEDFVPDDVLELAEGVDLLIHDSQHTCDEFEQKRHHGHSTVDYAVHVARQSGARRLALFHHCPSHSDDEVDALLAHASDLAEPTGIGSVTAAAEGATVTLTA